LSRDRHWKRSLDQRLRKPSELIPKGHMLELQKQVEGLERALDRKALDLDQLSNKTVEDYLTERLHNVTLATVSKERGY
jgi:hypothetical protein